MLERAAAAGVEAVLTIGNAAGPDDVDCALKLAREHAGGTPRIYASIGVHPHEAALAREEHFEHMQRLAAEPEIIGWGEIGLDYFYNHSPREAQQRVFVRQMELARAAELPIIIHCRPSEGSEDAWTDCLRLIREHWTGSAPGGVLHCFTGEPHHADAALEMGFTISFAGNVTFPKAAGIRESAKVVPLERMLLETDSPYLAPIPHRGKRNEPALVAETARHLAELRGVSTQELAAQTTRNFYRVFRLPEPGTR